MRRKKNHPLPHFDEQGILLVDKPSDWTSFDVVNCVRGRFNMSKIGHCGTLDPAATGLLVLVIGKKYTRQSQELSGQDKTYEAEILLGTETDSQDLDGEITAENDYSNITKDDLETALLNLRGPQQQIPPMVSAKKQNGQRLYKMARKGIVVERSPVDIEVFDIDISEINIPTAKFAVKVSKGTYIRTLCYDIGIKLGCGAVLKSLRRRQCGEFIIDGAVTIPELKEMSQDDLKKLLITNEVE